MTNKEDIDMNNAKFEYKMVEMDKLFIDNIYQRDLSKQKVNRLLKEWNEAVDLPVLVSKRDNGFYSVIDGQHRTIKKKIEGRLEVFCKVIEGLTIEDEAMLFTVTNKDRKSPSSGDMFRANLAAKDSLHMTIEDIVNKHNYELSFNGSTGNGTNKIQAVGTLKRICERISQENLDKTLELINVIWGNNKDALSGQMLSGVSRFINGAEKIKHFDKKRLIQKLQKKAPFEVIREGKSYKIMYGGEMEQNIALAIVDIYNERLRGGKIQAGDVLKTDRGDFIERA